MADIGAGDNAAIGVDGIGRIRDQHGIARSESRQRQMRQSFLRANGNNSLPFGVEVHVITAPVPVRDSLAQARDTPGERVAVGVASLRRLDQLVHDMPGSRLIGIAHAEIDDVFAARTRGRLQLINDVKDIRRQAFDAGEFFNQGDNRLSGVNPRLLE